MKKLVFALSFVFAGLGVYAQDSDLAQAETEAVEVAAEAQDDFSEIAVDELPAAVQEAVSTNYPSATINKAFVNESQQYKLEVALEDGTTGTLYADAEGNWIDM